MVKALESSIWKNHLCLKKYILWVNNFFIFIATKFHFVFLFFHLYFIFLFLLAFGHFYLIGCGLFLCRYSQLNKHLWDHAM